MDDTRNVVDYYKGWELESIKSDLDTKRNDLVVICESISGDFNKATVIRNLNGFSGRECWIVGRKKYDTRGTVGTHHYEHVKHSTDLAPVVSKLRSEGYVIYAVDNVMPAVSIASITNYNPKTAFIFGEEGRGLTDEALSLADQRIYVTMSGSVRSFNVGTTSGIIMYDYINKIGN